MTQQDERKKRLSAEYSTSRTQCEWRVEWWDTYTQGGPNKHTSSLNSCATTTSWLI